MTEKFDYYIFMDYSENLIGYDIIEKNKVSDLLPKLSRFRHYRNSKKRKLYLKKIGETIQREKIKDYFLKIKIKNKNNSLEIYSDVLEFLKKHENCLVFISVDDNQFRNFQKLVKIVNVKETKIIKESELKEGSVEHKISLVLDNLLNIERRNKK